MEFEVKFYLSYFEAIRARIIAIGGHQNSSRHFERNLRFDTPDRDLAGKKHVLRMRQDRRATMTFKRPLGQVEVREEFEIEIDDFETGLKFLNALGYVVTVTYEKYRETYQIDSVQAMLDELPFGRFVELEGPSIETVRQMSARLGLPWDGRVQASYLTLMERIRGPLDLKPDDVTFDNFIGLTPVDPELLGVRPIEIKD